MLKKIFYLALFFVLFTAKTVFAYNGYDDVLRQRIDELGVYENGTGIVYGSIEHFSDSSDMLFIAYVSHGKLGCEIYGDADGISRIDTLEFPISGRNLKISLAHKNNDSYILTELKDKGKTITEFYTVGDDAIKKIQPVPYDSITAVASAENSKITAYENRVYDFLDSLKLLKLERTKLINKADSVPAETKDKIRAVLEASADIMKFDIKNYNYDTLAKYVLCTHENFQKIIDIPSETNKSVSALGFDGISIVSGEYIDKILSSVFKATPEHPPVNALVGRGFCYSNGMYYYKNIFNTYFQTDIRDLTAIYDLGGGIYYVVFSDVYYENSSANSEYSFAVINTVGTPYSVMRLGMGETLLGDEEILQYSLRNFYHRSVWNTPEPYSPSPLASPIIPAVVSVGLVMLILGLIVVIKQLWDG